MAETKYGKYILKGSDEKVPSDKPGVRTRTLENDGGDWNGIVPRLNWKYVSQPAQVVDEPVSHDFDSFLVFTSADPAYPDKFPAEVEISMGEEGSKSIVNTPAIVCLPKGMVHGPITFTKVDEPVIYCYINLSGNKQ
ncbi:MAG: hypothetical protein JW712_13235 [Dehalococcoidales bacterium]|nr:hypothetical protein [Dehalococcoidales bacterium]